MEWFTLIKDISLATAAMVTALVAYKGLSRWQRELSGRASFDAARQLAKATYALRDEMRRCRSPLIAGAEFPEDYRRNPSSSQNSAEVEGAAWLHVYRNRWEPVAEAARAFDMATLEGEALWGARIRQKAEKMKRCVQHLQVDIDAFVSNKFEGGETFKVDPDFAKKVLSSVSDIKSDENELSQNIRSAIEELEAEIRPHLERS